MAFDLASAKPANSGFDLASAQPAQAVPADIPPESGLQHAKKALQVFARHPLTAGLGITENGISGFMGGVGSLLEALTGKDPGSIDLAYRPRTQAGQEIAQLGGDEATRIGQFYDQHAGTGPLAQTLKERLPQAAGAVSTITTLAGAPRVASLGRDLPPFRAPDAITPESIMSRMAQDSNQSMGAAAASPNLTNVSPELRGAMVSAARKTGGAINPQAFARQSEADTLPVRVRLTEGQATQNPALLSNEQNLRGKYSDLANHFAEQNKNLAENMQVLRDDTGPNVFTTNATEHGDTLIAAYKAKAAAADTQISDLYQKLRDAGGQNFPVDSKALLANATKELHKRLLFDHAPKEVVSTLERLAGDGMTFENFEALRTNLARTMRSPSADGNVKAAAGVIREEMEKLPLGAASAQLKPYADAARSAARKQFQAIEADPAYKAAVEDSVPPDRFVNRYVINGPRDDVATMRANLAGDDQALQTMSVSALDHLRAAARLDPSYSGNFSAAGYNKALQGLTPKLQSLLSPEVAEHLEKLGNVARYTTAQPRGSFVNNSNTFVAGAADYGASAVEGAANVAAHGIPVGTWGRKALQAVRTRKEIRRSLAPGAGLDRLELGSGGPLSGGK